MGNKIKLNNPTCECWEIFTRQGTRNNYVSYICRKCRKALNIKLTNTELKFRNLKRIDVWLQNDSIKV